MRPVLSIIIPTYRKSSLFLPYAIKGIENQKADRSNYEIIFGNNNGGKKVVDFAKKINAKVVDVNGKGPHIQDQKNAAIKAAVGDYIFILDHDEEMSPTLVASTLLAIKQKKHIDAWYLNFKLIEKGELLTKVRNFEESFYTHSVVAGARVIKRDLFINKIAFDPALNSGPGEWDIDLQLRDIHASFEYIEDYISHHEELLGFWGYVTKKQIYANGGEIYKRKWKKKNDLLYRDIIVRQYSPFYRLFWIFIEKGKWRRTISHLYLYFLFIMIKITMACIYSVSLLFGNQKVSKIHKLALNVKLLESLKR